MPSLVPEPLRLAKLNCLALAPAGASAGPPLLLVHGLGGGIWGWEQFQSHFAARGFASYALELPGHGPAPDARDAAEMGSYSVETYALHVAAAAAELGPCVIVGHSMGGLVAQKLAESHIQPGYVFLASAPPWHMFRRAYWPMWRHLLRHPWRQVLGPVIGRTLLLDQSMQDQLVNNRLPQSARGEIYGRDVPDSGRASMQMVVGLVSVAAHQVRSPCLVVGGWGDRLIPPSEQRRLAEKYRCPLQMYDRGHMLMIEAGWDEVADGILDWIAGACMPATTAAPPVSVREPRRRTENQAT